MRLRSIRHKALKRFVERDDAKGLAAARVDKIRKIITALAVAESIADIPALPGWRLHPLKGDRKGRWSLTVTGNWRITFEVIDDEVCDKDLEDYHR